jgi:hypothetical protein
VLTEASSNSVSMVIVFFIIPPSAQAGTRGAYRAFTALTSAAVFYSSACYDNDAMEGKPSQCCGK